MRSGFWLILMGMSVACSGCQLASNLCRNIYFEVSTCVDDTREWVQARKEANAAWKECPGPCPGATFSPSFEAGFKGGFADWYLAGGMAPVVVPPSYCTRSYWRSVREYQAALDWWAGWRVGAAAARERGSRAMAQAVIPVDLSGPFVPAPSALNGWPGWPDPVCPSPVEPVPIQSLAPTPGPGLPAPRPMPASAAPDRAALSVFAPSRSR